MAGNDVPQVRWIRGLEAARLAIADLSCANNIDCHAACFAIRGRYSHERYCNRSVARHVHFARDDERCVRCNRLQERHPDGDPPGHATTGRRNAMRHSLRPAKAREISRESTPSRSESSW